MTIASTQKLRIKLYRALDFSFEMLSWFLLIATLAFLAAIFYDLIHTGSERLTYLFFTSFPSGNPAEAGILSAWVGTLCVITVTTLLAIPIGIGAGIYLEEYAKKNWITSLIEINISNLAGVPSIVYGLMALGLFVYKLNLGQTILTAGLTLALLVLPIMIVTTREAIRTVPISIREAAYACGASRLQVVTHHVLPYSAGGIMTGIIIAVSRAIGETAPLITIGALTFIAFLPHSPVKTSFPFVSFEWLNDSFTVLPIQMFNWVSRPQEEFHMNAAAAGLVLILLTFFLNGIAIYIRLHFRRKIKW